MSGRLQKQSEAGPIDVVKRGSVSIPIYYAPVTAKLEQLATNGSSVEESKKYDSYVITYYEGSLRVQKRRNTLERARIFAAEIAERLQKDGAKAGFISEQDRRIYILAKAAADKVGLAVDEVCRRYSELQQASKHGTPTQAVEFMNTYGQRVQHGVHIDHVYEKYLEELKKRGVGVYHLRDAKRYVSRFVEALPGVLSNIDTPKIDAYLTTLGGKARNKNNHRKAIITFYNFAQEKGFLPQGIPHPALATTEFGDARVAITSEAQAVALLQPTDIYSPEEGRKILAASEGELKATLEIKMLSGVRTEEIVRLWWVMVDEKAEVIRVPDAVGKIDARQVPILPALKDRLLKVPTAMKRDRIAGQWTISNSLYHAWQRACKKAGVPYRRNAFRNSYFTYRLAILGQGEIEKIATEGGTSVAMLKKNYLSRAPVSRATAEEWFAL